MAPEQWVKDVGELSVKVDVYAFGVMLNEMFTRAKPYSILPFHPVRVVNNGDRPRCRNILEFRDIKCVRLLVKTILRCWATRPSRRPSMARV